MLSKLSSKHKFIFTILFGAATVIKLAHWYYYRSAIGLPTHIPMIFWESLVLLALLFWNPKGIRLILLAVLGFLIIELIFFNYAVEGMSYYPFWYLFRDIYGLLNLDSLYAFLIELVLLVSMTVSLFIGKPKVETELLDSDYK